MDFYIQRVHENWENLPTYVVGEYLFITLSIVGLLHAITRKEKSTLYLAVWISSIISGCANDVFFMTLPFVDNFWHSQTTIMLTPRLPLYILCLYNVFMYYSVVAVWELKLKSKLLEAVLIGLFAELIYSPFDIIGAKFIWWTWHDTDVAIRERLLGVPIGSSLWVIVFTTVFAYLIRRSTSNAEKINFVQLLKCVSINAMLCTPLMLVCISLIQIVSKPGIPDLSALLFCLLLDAIVIIYYSRKETSTSADDNNDDKKKKKISIPKKNSSPQSSSSSSLSSKSQNDVWKLCLKLAILSYFLILIVIMGVGIPENHISTGIHQTVGPCDVTDYDLAGNLRQLYLCLPEYVEDYSFQCTNVKPSMFQEWYTICGVPHSDYNLYLRTVIMLGLLGITVYSYLFSR